MRRSAAALLALLAGAAGEARGDTGDTLLAIGYVSSLSAGALATAVNGSHLAFGEPAPRAWRIFGYVAGGVDVAWGGVALATSDGRGEGIAVGSLALAMGAAALVTAIVVDEEDDRPRVVPVALPGGAGIGLRARF